MSSANKVAYTPAVTTQYSSPVVSSAYGKQVSYGTNPLLGYSAYKTGAYVTPGLTTSSVNTAGYHASSLG